MKWKKRLITCWAFLYGYDNTSLLIELMKALKERKLTITAAESLTGGLVSTGINIVFQVQVQCLRVELFAIQMK